jgi:hypothetical protein
MAQGMTDKRRCSLLRRLYREKWDAYQGMAHKNAQLLEAGRHPSNDQLMDEQEAAVAVAFARDELRRAMANQVS